MLTCEELLLLFLNPKKGKLPLKIYFFKYAIPAMVLEDLRVKGKIDILKTERKKRKKTIYSNVSIKVLDSTSTSNPILDAVLKTIDISNGKSNKIYKWFSKAGKNLRYLQSLIWESLEQQGVVQRNGNRINLTQPEVKENLRNTYRELIKSRKMPNAPHKGMFSILYHTENLRVFGKDLKIDEYWYNRITHGDVIGVMLAEFLRSKKHPFEGSGTITSPF